MDHLTVLLVLTLTLTLTLTGVSSQPSNSDQYQGEDGNMYYNSSKPCTLSSFYPAGRAYNAKTATYTIRDEVKCCTYAKTRDSCCRDPNTNQCKCDAAVVCDLQTTTVAPTTTAEPTTTTELITTTPESTTTTPESTTTTPESTTTTPESTTTTPESTTTTLPTTTTETTTAPTPTVFKSLCPKPQARVLNGQAVPDDCPFAGISKIVNRERNNVVCNAVYTLATVNGTLKPTFLTDGFCKRIIEASFSSNVTQMNIWIGDKTFPLAKPIFTLIDGPNGTAFLDVGVEYLELVNCLGPCQKLSCPFNVSTMEGLVDFGTCKVLSSGTMNKNLKQNGLYEVPVALNEGGCSGVTVSNNNNTMCFRAVSGLNLYCSGDNGAPVYCKAPSNQEWILVGVTARQQVCDYGSEIKVLPHPG